MGFHRRALSLAAAGLAASIGAGTAGLVLPAPARAAAPACPTLNGTALTLASTVTPPDGGSQLFVCSGGVPTFDGTPLRVDISLPTAPYIPAGSSTPAAQRPLIIFLSGYSNDRCQFESTSQAGAVVPTCHDYIGNAGYHWNNAYFASQGWVSLNYTPRGWFDSCGKIAGSDAYYPEYPMGYSYLSDTTCSSTTGEQSWVHLYDRRYEIRDTQFLAGLLVDALNNPNAIAINPSQIVTTGDSGGGGPSWDLALSSDSVVKLDATPTSVDVMPWTSPSGTSLHLAAALPLYTWTDLVDSLVSNGTASDGFNGAPLDGNHQSPYGVEKQSYVGGLYAKGISNVPDQPGAGAQYVAPPNSDPTADLNKWFADIEAGEPTFSANPDTPTIVAQIGGPLRSPFAIPVPVDDEKPIFVIQGLTDPLFPSLQALTMINRLKAADPTYPVYAFLGDIGHSYAQNPLDVWQQAHLEGNTWLGEVLNGNTHPPDPTITMTTTRCIAGQTLQSYGGSNFGSIASTQLAFNNAAAQSTTNPASDPEGPQTDPIVGGGCKSIAASSPADSPQATYIFPVSSAFTLVGGPVVNVTASFTAGTDAEFAARLWDVDASGTSWLVTRTVYRLAAPPAAPLKFELWPNAWQFQCGHSIKLELTQVDTPTWRPDNLSSSLSFTGMNLSLPVISSPTCFPGVATAESPLTPALPLGALAAIGGITWMRRRRQGRA